eukprot:Em0016g1014a
MVCATLHLFIAAVTICSALGQNTDGNVSDSVTQPTDNVNTSIQPIDTNTTAATVGFTSTNADSSSSSPLSTFSVQYSISSTATSQTASGNISQPPTQTTSMNELDPSPTESISSMNQFLKPTTSANHSSIAQTNPSLPNEPTLQSTSSVNQSLSQPTSTIPLMNQSLSQPTSTIPLVNQLSTSITQPTSSSNEPTLQSTPAPSSVNQSLSQPTSTIPLVNQSLSQPTSTIPLVNQSLSQPTSTIPLVNQSLSQPTSTIPLVNQLSTSITQPTSSSNEPTLQSTPAPSSVNQSIPTETQATSPFSPPLNMSITATPNQVIPTSDKSEDTSTRNQSATTLSRTAPAGSSLYSTQSVVSQSTSLATLQLMFTYSTQIAVTSSWTTSQSSFHTVSSSPTSSPTSSLLPSLSPSLPSSSSSLPPSSRSSPSSSSPSRSSPSSSLPPPSSRSSPSSSSPSSSSRSSPPPSSPPSSSSSSSSPPSLSSPSPSSSPSSSLPRSLQPSSPPPSPPSSSPSLSATNPSPVQWSTILVTITFKKPITIHLSTEAVTSWLAGLLHVKPELIKEVEIKKPKTNSRWARHLQQDIEGIHFRLLSQDRQASKKILNSLKNSSVILDGQEAVLDTIMQGEWAIYSGNGTPTPVGGQGKLSAGAITGIVIVCIVGVLVIVLFLGAICTIASRRRKYGTYEFELPHTDAMSNGIKADPISEKVVR